MYFILRCLDRPGSAGLRAATRPKHLDYLERAGKKIKLGGPMLDRDGETPIGSLLIVEAGDATEAQALAAADPYAEAGLFESVTITPWKWVIGKL